MACFCEKEWIRLDAGETPNDTMRKHLDACAFCRDRMSEGKQWAEFLKKASFVHPETSWDHLHSRVMAALPYPPVPRRIPLSIPRLGWAIGVLVLLGIGLAFVGTDAFRSPVPGITEATEWTMDPADAFRQASATLPESDSYAAQKLDSAKVMKFFENEFTLEETMELMDSLEIKQVAILLAGR